MKPKRLFLSLKDPGKFVWPCLGLAGDLLLSLLFCFSFWSGTDHPMLVPTLHFVFVLFFLAAPCGLRDLSSPTRD